MADSSGKKGGSGSSAQHAGDPERLLIREQEIVRADFSGRRLDYLGAVGSRFEQCRFERMTVAEASLGAGQATSTYVDCVFDGSVMDLTVGGFARFERCSFRDVRLTNWLCRTVELVDCVFSGTLQRAIFRGGVEERLRPVAGRASNEFSGNDFSAMDLVDVAFRDGIDLSAQKLPTGADYVYLPDGPAALEGVATAVAAIADDGLRAKATSLLGVLRRELANGQRQLLLRAGTYLGPERRPRPQAVFVFEELRRFAAR